MNYLIVEGYKDAAAHFLEESGTQPKVDLRTIEDRVAIRKVGVIRRRGCYVGRKPEFICTQYRAEFQRVISQS